MINNTSTMGGLYAEELRGKLGLGIAPISDIFAELSRQEIWYIRYPLGSGSISGLATRRAGQLIVVSNSDKTLGHEHFTVAHELAHALYHLSKPGKNLIVDDDHQSETDPREQFANSFAAAFLMPSSGVTNSFLKLIDQSPCKAGIEEILHLAQYYKVSFSAMLVRLSQLNLISPSQFNELKEKSEHQSLTFLATQLGYSADLYQPSNVIQIPNTNIQQVKWLYESGKIPYSRLEEFVSLIGKKPGEMGISKPLATEEEEEIESETFNIEELVERLDFK